MPISFRMAAAMSAATLALSLNVRAQQPAPPQPARPQPAAPKGPLAPEKYKNIQVLKDLPAEDLDGVMRFMNASLGVGCEFCHVQSQTGPWPMEKDDIDHKKLARQMIEMMRGINEKSFEGRNQVNCASCHHGRNEPDRVPPLAQEMTADQIAAAAARGQAPAQPVAGSPAGRGGRGGPRPTETVDQVLDAYVQALGGRAALEKTTSRVMRGTVTDRAGQASPIVVEEKAPAMVRQTIESKPAALTLATDGTKAWGQAGSTTWDAESAIQVLDATKLAELALPLQIRQRYQNLQVVRYAKIDGRDMLVVAGRTTPIATEQLFFDRLTGLLVRRVISTRTAFGNLPEQIDYSEYRVVDGVKVPFQVKRASWENVLTAKYTDVKLNVALDNARFAKP